MKTVTIPTCANPFVVIVNGIKYTYPAGATVEVPDDVAEVIEQHEEAKTEPAPVQPPYSGDDILAAAKAYTDKQRLGYTDVGEEITFDGDTTGKFVKLGYVKISDEPMDLNGLDKIQIAHKNNGVVSYEYFDVNVEDEGNGRQVAKPMLENGSGTSYYGAMSVLTDGDRYGTYWYKGLYLWAGNGADWCSSIKFADIVHTIDPKYMPPTLTTDEKVAAALQEAKDYTDSQHSGLGAFDVSPAFTWDGDTTGRKTGTFGTGMTLYNVSDTPYDLNELTKVEISTGVVCSIGRVQNIDNYNGKFQEVEVYDDWGDMIGFIVSVENYYDGSRGLYVFRNEYVPMWVSLLRFGEDNIVPIDQRLIPAMDSITLNGADGKQYKLTVDASGALAVTAVV